MSKTNFVGFGELNGGGIWMRNCEFQSFAHEFGHNLGLQHSGAQTTGGSWAEYLDVSSIMSTTLLIRLKVVLEL
jgi:hypothetical protein